MVELEGYEVPISVTNTGYWTIYAQYEIHGYHFVKARVMPVPQFESITYPPIYYILALEEGFGGRLLFFKQAVALSGIGVTLLSQILSYIEGQHEPA